MHIDFNKMKPFLIENFFDREKYYLYYMKKNQCDCNYRNIIVFFDQRKCDYELFFITQSHGTDVTFIL